jgi:cellobiose phosphorylase
MSAVVPKTTGERFETATGTPPANPFGKFSPDGLEYRIHNHLTPRPWVNIIANPRFGIAVSQTGSGFSWIDNSQLAVITRWQQEFAHDASGRFLYARDVDSGRDSGRWPRPRPSRQYESYLCRHGIGYTIFETTCHGIEATLVAVLRRGEVVEYWLIELRNISGKPRRLALCSYLEWCCGVAPSPRREFHKLFIETRYDASATP